MANPKENPDEGVVLAGAEPNEKREGLVVDAVVLLVGDLKEKAGGPDAEDALVVDAEAKENDVAGLEVVFSPNENPVEAVDDAGGADGAPKKFKLGLDVSGFDSEGVLAVSAESIFPNENVEGFLSESGTAGSG